LIDGQARGWVRSFTSLLLYDLLPFIPILTLLGRVSRPPPMMGDLDAADIVERLDDEDLVLRVHDYRSISILQHDGFTANDVRFKPRTSTRKWISDHQQLRADIEWRESYETVCSMAAHVTGGWNKQRIGFQSPWLSTTGSLEWAVWEIARRLTIMSTDKVELSAIRRQKTFSPRYRGAKPLAIVAERAFRSGLPIYGLNSALNFARSSSEVLYYGRIFDKDVLETWEFTLEDKDLALPEEYLRPRKYWRHNWVNNLVWDPREDSFYTAEEKIEKRRIQLEDSRR